MGEENIERGNAETIKEFHRVSGNNAGTYWCYDRSNNDVVQITELSTAAARLRVYEFVEAETSR